jgi:hypothetical protein
MVIWLPVLKGRDSPEEKKKMDFNDQSYTTYNSTIHKHFTG